MSPKDSVAMILAVGVVVTLMATTSLRYLYIEPGTPPADPETVRHWKDLTNVIIGALAGYIAGEHREK